MNELIRIQKKFKESIFQKNLKELNFIRSNLADERLEIYRQTIYENMRNALKITFPGIWTLLGEECANNAAFAFCKLSKNLPKTGCLDDFGEEFPSFLGSLQELHPLPYLKDYASYEWIKHLAHSARRTPAISPLSLQSLPEQIIEDITFSLVPACYLFSSIFPLVEINEIVKNAQANAITLNKKPSYAIIVGLKDDVYTFWISKGNWILIEQFFLGKTLSHSADYAAKSDNDFNLNEGIALALKMQIIKSIVYQGETYVS